jgi:hypothetical protein
MNAQQKAESVQSYYLTVGLRVLDEDLSRPSGPAVEAHFPYERLGIVSVWPTILARTVLGMSPTPPVV